MVKIISFIFKILLLRRARDVHVKVVNTVFNHRLMKLSYRQNLFHKYIKFHKKIKYGRRELCSNNGFEIKKKSELFYKILANCF